MSELYMTLEGTVIEDGVAVLAKIIRQSGSSPRALGTSCVFRKDGSIIGTIGGGILEAMTSKAAIDVAKTRMPRRIFFSLTGTQVAQTDMLCGGQVEIFLEPVAKDSRLQADIIKKIKDTAREGGSGILATIVQEEAWGEGAVPKAFFEKTGLVTGCLNVGKDVVEAVRERMGDLIRKRAYALLQGVDLDGGAAEIFLEPIVGDHPLFVFGAGHVSRQVVPLASRVGFRVVVVDDREDFADPLQFPDASEVHALPFGGLMDRLGVGEESFLVIVTRGHMHDRDVLAQALRTKARYIGMIGSRRKRDAIYESLLEGGFTREDISRVHCPIGIDIGAEIPEEIAVSIVAELIKIRAGKE
ncbi:MAG: hypothetical protein C4582_01545 [Desulfobacteraceae bacterium]|jgi:xanthine dehydrogenase accessory factor|nr:MAG: hypothetical protein C4582_01545 [Desulfobacteraceae bacterium]